MLWWDFHQTFHDPLHLFNANIFYPLPYTLAFSESNYGIAIFLFPLYALGLRPLTVHSIGTFLSFAFTGYGTFRLTRTLVASEPAAWIAGITFAFIPFRFHVLSQITYVCAGWMPLLLEALVLFLRLRSWKRAAWLAVAFAMNALTSLTWMSLSLVPLALSAVGLISLRRVWRDRNFWVRGTIAAAGSLLILFPFLWPYLRVSKLYGFTWGPELVTKNSPTVWNWLVADYRIRFWRFLDARVGVRGAKMFPGVIAPALALASLAIEGVKRSSKAAYRTSGVTTKRIVSVLNAAAVGAAVFMLASLAFANSQSWRWLGRVFAGPTLKRSAAVLIFVLVIRALIVYRRGWWRCLRSIGASAQALVNSKYREALCLGWIWFGVGFLMSSGMNSWLFRFLFEHVFIFRSMREPSRAAMVACLGIALLAGLGTVALNRVLGSWPRVASYATIALAVLILLDVHVAPMSLTQGAVDPDELAIWLKQKQMRGGLVELPTGTGVLPHLYMLRAADHGKPLINATSTFVPEHAATIDKLSQQTPIPKDFIDAMEAVPASYLIIHNNLIDQERRSVFELFLARGMASGRLRFIRRLGNADAYAIVRTEPDAVAEQTNKPDFSERDWATRITESPQGITGLYLNWSQRLYRLSVAATGKMPRYAEFLALTKTAGSDLFGGDDDRFAERERQVARELVERNFARASDDELLTRLLENAGLTVNSQEHDRLRANLKPGIESRIDLLLTVANDQRVIEHEKGRSLVLLHYFAYLQRNPDDPPDKDLSGFNYWVQEVEKHGGKDLASAFSSSIERNASKP